MGLFNNLHKKDEKILDEKLEKLRQALLHKEKDKRHSVLRQAKYAHGRLEYVAFDQAYQASKRLCTAETKENDDQNQISIKLCNEAINLLPNFSAAHTFLAKIYRLYHKNYETALRYARKATKADPGNEYAWLELGKISVQLENVIGSTEAFRKVIILNSEIDDPEPFARMEWVYELLGMENELIECQDRYSRLNIWLEANHQRRWQRLIVKADRQKLQDAAIE